jgi:hypothetical protein
MNRYIGDDSYRKGGNIVQPTGYNMQKCIKLIITSQKPTTLI